MQDYQTRSKIHPKQTVRVKVKNPQTKEYDQEAEGRVKSVLTKSETHYRGIKVMLEDGTVGRVVEIVKKIK